MDDPSSASVLAAIVDSADDAIVSKDLNGIIKSWNAGAERLFGYTAAEAIGQSITFLIPTDRLSEEDTVLSHIRRGLRIDHFETLRRRKDGSLVPISLTVSPVRNESGTIVGASKIARDITDQKRAAERLEEQGRIHAQLYQDSQDANRAKDDFLATLSHELRTPLNVIMGWSRILRGTAADDVLRQRAIDTIERNARTQAQLIDDLLDISRIVAGKLTIEAEDVDIGAVVAAAIEDIQPALAARQLSLQWALGDDAFIVRGDVVRLQQIVRNLLSNAVKFTPAHGRVTVTVRRHGDLAQIVIADTGIGIAPALIGHVFERFRQGDPSITREHGGLGLGLEIVRYFTTAHGGTVEAASEGEGCGATFTVSLPLHAAGVVSRERGAAAAAARAATVRLSGVSVLIVEDNVDAGELMAVSFRRRGATVTSASSGSAAIAEFDRRAFDVLLSDLAMPGMDGFELIRAVREREREAGRAPVVAMAVTAMCTPREQDRAIAAGFNWHVRKPVDPDALVAHVAQLTTVSHRLPAPRTPRG